MRLHVDLVPLDDFKRLFAFRPEIYAAEMNKDVEQIKALDWLLEGMDAMHASSASE
jgi:hypothetical protein